MVYDRLPRAIKHVHIDLDMELDQVTLVRPYIEWTIVATCKLIKEETSSLLERTITQFILERPPRIIGSTGCHCSTFALETLARLSTVQLCEMKQGRGFLKPNSLYQQLRQRYPGPANHVPRFDKMAEFLLLKSGSRKEVMAYIRVSAAQLLWQSAGQADVGIPKLRLEYIYRHQWSQHPTPADYARELIQVVDLLHGTTLKNDGFHIDLVGLILWPNNLSGISVNTVRVAGYRVTVPRMMRRPLFNLRVALQGKKILEQHWIAEWDVLKFFGSVQSYGLTQWLNLPNAVDVRSCPRMSLEHWKEHWMPTVVTYSMKCTISGIQLVLAFLLVLGIGTWYLGGPELAFFELLAVLLGVLVFSRS